ncbi:hypothetical protein KC19_10G096300 [Ceratodon purpureus]|uniref:Uncharacterized protein n=1 Tax=Ceratodon purpureus TaxID=3225 RepID=A0A8T0GM91_CERPU|nr:hypothetical protein KC19_10G096300 [Ceratodon purpureus]
MTWIKVLCVDLRLCPVQFLALLLQEERDRYSTSWRKRTMRMRGRTRVVKEMRSTAAPKRG